MTHMAEEFSKGRESIGNRIRGKWENGLFGVVNIVENNISRSVNQSFCPSCTFHSSTCNYHTIHCKLDRLLNPSIKCETNG